MMDHGGYSSIGHITGALYSSGHGARIMDTGDMVVIDIAGCSGSSGIVAL